MKDFKDILVTQLEEQKKHFDNKKSLVNCKIFQIMAAKQCSGHYIVDVTLLDIK